MRARASDLWENATSSFWFVPGLLVLAAGLLAIGAGALDEALTAAGRQSSALLFTGSADAARDVLSTVAGALVTVMALTFSVMMVAFSQLSSQLSPRVLRLFMEDRTNQLVLGSYSGTFAYCLLVLRMVRSETADEPGFVPGVAITGAILLTLWCLALLIYFFHHVAELLQASTVTRWIGDEALRQLDRLYPASVGRPASPHEEEPPRRPEGEPVRVRAREAGFLRRVDEDQLLGVAGPGVHLVWVHPRIGVYVGRRAVMAEVWAEPGAVDEDAVEAIRSAFVLGSERTLHQDLLFGVRQLVDIAVKALSPGVNDPTTAEYALAYLRDTVVLLADRAFPPRLRKADRGETLFWVERPTFEDVVAAAFSQIRRAAANDAHVTATLLDALAAVQEHAAPAERAETVRREVAEVVATLDGGPFSPADRAFVRAKADAILAGGGPEVLRRPGDFQNIPA